MVTDGIINTEEIITDEMPLSRIQEAFKLRDNPPEGSIHVVINCEE